MMTNKIIIDTNILIYSADEKHPFYNYSIGIIKEHFNNICITSKNISEFVAVQSKANIPYVTIIKELSKFV